MNILSPEQIIRGTFGKSKNFMTPHTIRVGSICPNYAYELSSGTGIFHDVIYGVSLAIYSSEGGTFERCGGECFFVLQEAEDYIKKLKQEYRAEKKEEKHG